ncbi:MAG: hypothetical protein GDA45_04125 [Chromatiales bacterium]|nr:hypothetical protein [Chromatiales bacterium]
MAVKRRSRNFEIFNLSFLDVISCGFGAVVLLVLLSKSTIVGGTVDIERIAELIRTFSQAQTLDSDIKSQSQQLSSTLNQQSNKETQLKNAITKATQTLSAMQSENTRLSAEVTALRQKLKSPSATISADSNVTEEIYAGGIPVDADHIIFIVDTSGSMQEIWARVMREMENILNIHPEVKGFQILNDNGIPLISAYKGKWLNDTPSLRSRVLRLLRTWQAFSNSSPVEGLQEALRRYVKRGMKVSIYILGDDYTGSSYDPVLQTVARLNTDPSTGKPIARIHGIGFYNQQGGDILRLSTLMREVARQSNGTFIALD